MNNAPTYSGEGQQEPLTLTPEELEKEAAEIEAIFKAAANSEIIEDLALLNIDDILREADLMDLAPYYDQSPVSPLGMISVSANPAAPGTPNSSSTSSEKFKILSKEEQAAKEEADKKAAADKAIDTIELAKTQIRAKEDLDLEEEFSQILAASSERTSSQATTQKGAHLPVPPILSLAHSEDSKVDSVMASKQDLELIEILTGEDSVNEIEYATDEEIDPQIVQRAFLAQSQATIQQPGVPQTALVAPTKKETATKSADKSKIEDDVTGDPYTIDDDVNDDGAIIIERQKRKRFKNKFFIFMGFSATISFILGAYVHFEQKYHKESLDAMKSLSDISASLLHHKIYLNLSSSHGADSSNPNPVQVAPNSLDSIQNNLKDILSYPYQMLSPVNTPSGLKLDGYDLDIFYQKDLENFAVVASPQRNFISLLMNKPGFAIDSSDFTLYTYHIDLSWKNVYSALNSPEQWVSEEDVASLKRKSSLCPISQLNFNDPNLGYLPPADLKEINAHAMNYIYNLPRYYPLLSRFADKAAALGRNEIFSEDITFVREVNKRIYTLKDIVVYASSGATGAMQMYNGLKEFSPESHFIYGYVEINPATQRLTYFQLLKEEDAIAANKMKLASQTQSTTAEEMIGAIYFLTPLRSAINQRKAILDEIQSEIKTLEENHPDGFENIYQNFLNKYATANAASLANIQKIITSIYRENVDIPQRIELYKLIKQSGLETAIAPEITQELETFVKQYALEQILSEESIQHLNGIVDQIQTASKFEEIEMIISSFKQSMAERISHIDILQQDTLNRRLQTEVLHRVGSLILSKESAKNSLTFQEYNRIILERLLEYVGLSPQEEVHYYIEEFDRLIDQINKCPNSEEIQKFQYVEKVLLDSIKNEPYLTDEQKKNAEDIKLASLKQLDLEMEHVKDLEKKIHQIPLQSLPTISPAEQNAINSRIAQQMIYVKDASFKETSRSQELMIAIELLSPLVNEALGLWKDILEARYQLLKLKEPDIKALLASGLGFTLHEEALFPIIKSTLEKYQQEKQKLAANPSYSDQYPARYKVFKNNSMPQLDLAFENIQVVRTKLSALLKSILEYRLELQRYLDSYLQSQDQGYFSTNYELHSLTLARIKIALKQANRLEIEFNTAGGKIEATCKKYEILLNAEKNSLEKDAPINPGATAKLLQEINSISAPNIFKDNLPKRLFALFGMSINPNSKNI